MRSLALLFFGSLVAIALATLSAMTTGCSPLDESTTCARAKNMLGECGVMLPLLESDTCTGAAEEISKCIVTTNGSCDALATLEKNLSQCMTTDGGEMPSDFPQIRARDGGPDGASASQDRDADVPDATSTIVDAGSSIPTGVFDVSGSIASGEQQPFTTSRLAAGTYTFSFSTTGAVDVYVRKGFAPTTTTFDCTTSDPSVTCTEPVASSAILYVLVVGEASNSTFRIDAQP